MSLKLEMSKKRPMKCYFLGGGGGAYGYTMNGLLCYN